MRCRSSWRPPWVGITFHSNRNTAHTPSRIGLADPWAIDAHRRPKPGRRGDAWSTIAGIAASARGQSAARLDEGLQLLTALWSGEPVKHHGEHFQVECAAFQPPAQRPRPPIWVAAAWPAKRPLARAARWDGVVPVGGAQGLEVAPRDLAQIVATIRAQRSADTPFDVTQFGVTRDPGDTAAAAAAAEAGATWWIDYVYARGGSLEAARRRLGQGPPRR